MKYFKLLLVVILIVSLPIITNARSCGDKYDDCCNNCWNNYIKTGYSTDCYDNCYDEYEDCGNDWLFGCFISVL